MVSPAGSACRLDASAGRRSSDRIGRKIHATASLPGLPATALPSYAWPRGSMWPDVQSVVKEYLMKAMHHQVGRALLLWVAIVVLAVLSAVASAGATAANKPTVLLVHGAFAESSSWDSTAEKLLAHGYAVIAIANPLRGVKSD